jgi:adenylate cyclase
LTPLLQERLLSFVPALIRNAVESKNSVRWLSGYRRAYIMFVSLGEIDYKTSFELTRIQQAVVVVQDRVSYYKGMVSRLIADDKGTRFKIVFGMPTQVHEDDGVRVVLTALEIQKHLKILNFSPLIGIANGQVYCGEAGSDQRSEFTAVGFKVNLAARLMQASKEHGILVDKATYEAAVVQRILFESLKPIAVKNVSEPVEVFKPLVKLSAQDWKKIPAMVRYLWYFMFMFSELSIGERKN